MASNFNNTTPAAPAGSTNVAWLTDGSGNNSASVPTSAIELVVDNLDLTAQDANISATTLFTPAASGMYSISIYIIVTTADGASSTLPSVTIGWTDADNTTAQTQLVTATSAGNSLTTFKNGTCVINAATGVAVTYATASYASGTPTAMKYSLHIRIESL
jgi:hypothetical protein